jgi:hypothetical protein
MTCLVLSKETQQAALSNQASCIEDTSQMHTPSCKGSVLLIAVAA